MILWGHPERKGGLCLIETYVNDIQVCAQDYENVSFDILELLKYTEYRKKENDLKQTPETQAKEMLRKKIVYPINQKKLAAEIGVTPSHLNQVLRGTKKLTAKYYSYLGVEAPK